MYSIPLRRALATNSDLPYPEGVACAEVLKVGSTGDTTPGSSVEHGKAGLLAVMWGSIISAVFAIIVATQLFAADVAQTFRIGRRGAVSGYDFSLSFALLAIGHLVGLSVGLAMLLGAVIGWDGACRTIQHWPTTSAPPRPHSRKVLGVIRSVSSARARSVC